MISFAGAQYSASKNARRKCPVENDFLKMKNKKSKNCEKPKGIFNDFVNFDDFQKT
jgi:hypothetical protein